MYTHAISHAHTPNARPQAWDSILCAGMAPAHWGSVRMDGRSWWLWRTGREGKNGKEAVEQLAAFSWLVVSIPSTLGERASGGNSASTLVVCLIEAGRCFVDLLLFCHLVTAWCRRWMWQIQTWSWQWRWQLLLLEFYENLFWCKQR